MTTPTGDALKASAAQVQVKPLEWRRSGWVEGFAQPEGLGVWYSIQPPRPSRGPGDPPFTLRVIWGVPGQTMQESLGEDFPSLDAAKAVAQSDYERRILAALSVEPAPQPVAWQPAYKPEFIEYLRRTRGDMNEPKVFFPTKKEAEDYGFGGHDARPLYDWPSSIPSHSDDLAVDRFAVAMKAKLAKKRTEGRGGWDNPDECSIAFLSELLRSHIDKGDPVDVGNLAMMIHQRGGVIE